MGVEDLILTGGGLGPAERDEAGLVKVVPREFVEFWLRVRKLHPEDTLGAAFDALIRAFHAAGADGPALELILLGTVHTAAPPGEAAAVREFLAAAPTPHRLLARYAELRVATGDPGGN